MEKFTNLEGIVAPLDRGNVDTDAIIPKQFLKSIKRSGFGANLFDAWRFLDHGEPGMDASTRRPNPDFILNQSRYKGTSVLLARKNFGCGSSREHAPWALADYGIKAVIAPSFGEIFFNNSLKNGLLPIKLTDSEVNQLFHDVEAFPGFRLNIDLEQQTVSYLDGSSVFRFDIDPFRKDCMLNGLDEIGLTLNHADEIRAYEDRHKTEQPWLFS